MRWRRRLLYAAAVVMLAVVGYGITVFAVNSRLTPTSVAVVPDKMPGLPDAVGNSLTITTWNLGYAGLGAGSDFVADGGKSFLPPSRGAVEANLAGIETTLRADTADIVLLQEVSNRSPLSWWVPVRERIEALLGGRQQFYREDAATRFIPYPLALDHGTIAAARYNPSGMAVIPLPSEPGAMLGFLKRRYGLQVLRFPIVGSERELVVANLHLSAFDDGGSTRLAQLEAALAFGEAEYARGNHVVLGGDWNMELAPSRWPSTSEQKHLFWIMPFPPGALPDGWTIATGENAPTARTLYKSYVAGENYVTSIDGFIVSPNIAVEATTVTHMGFAHSDHQPVTTTLVLLP